MKPHLFRVIVADQQQRAPGSSPFTGAAQLRYVARIARKSPSGDRFRATDFVDERELAATFTFNVAQAVANRNHGALETV